MKRTVSILLFALMIIAFMGLELSAEEPASGIISGTVVDEIAEPIEGVKI